MTDLQDRLVAPCADFDSLSDRASPDISALFNRLLIFETYFLQSIRFKEFAPLVQVLGIENVILLLDSGALGLVLNPTQFCQSGQVSGNPSVREKPALPSLSFSFSVIRAGHYNEYLIQCLQQLRRDLGYVHAEKDVRRLEGAILRALTPVKENAGADAYAEFLSDLRGNSPVFKPAIAMHLRTARGLAIAPADISLSIHALDEADFKTESNLDQFGLSPTEVHTILERSILAAGGVNLRIEEMRDLNALSGSVDDELPLFGDKFSFLRTTLSPGSREETFDKVIAIRGLPSFDFQQPTRAFAMDRFLTIRNSRECKDFRQWLKQATLNEELISENVGSISSRLAPFIHGTTGKGIRLAVTVGAGLLPGIGLALGTTLSAIDMFIWEKILPLSGPTAFLSRSYRSLFKNADPGDLSGKTNSNEKR